MIIFVLSSDKDLFPFTKIHKTCENMVQKLDKDNFILKTRIFAKKKYFFKYGN